MAMAGPIAEGAAMCAEKWLAHGQACAGGERLSRGGIAAPSVDFGTTNRLSGYPKTCQDCRWLL
jgi:hypothetical protein